VTSGLGSAIEEMFLTTPCLTEEKEKRLQGWRVGSVVAGYERLVQRYREDGAKTLLEKG
jgi:hypothetical protein